MQEATDPKRVVTAVVRTADPRWPCVPVRTDAPVPKPAIAGLLRELYGLTVALPVRQGDAVLSDFHGSGINVVVTRTLPDPAGEAAP